MKFGNLYIYWVCVVGEVKGLGVCKVCFIILPYFYVAFVYVGVRAWKEHCREERGGGRVRRLNGCWKGL